MGIAVGLTNESISVRRLGSAAGQPFEIQDVASGDAHTLVIIGELEMATAPALEAAIAPLAASARRLTLDLSRVTFMDSTGLNLVMETKQLCRDHRAEFALIPGPQNVQHVFEVTGLLHRLPFRTPPAS